MDPVTLYINAGFIYHNNIDIVYRFDVTYIGMFVCSIMYADYNLEQNSVVSAGL